MFTLMIHLGLVYGPFWAEQLIQWTACIWSQTHLIPRLPVPHFLSPWTYDPHKIDPPGQTVPIKFGPQGQMVPKNLVPLHWTNGPKKFGPPGQMVPNQFGPHISGSPQPVPCTKGIL